MLDAGRTAQTVNLTFQRGHDWSFPIRQDERPGVDVGDVHDGARRGRRRAAVESWTADTSGASSGAVDMTLPLPHAVTTRQATTGTGATSTATTATVLRSRSAVALSPSNWGSRDRHVRKSRSAGTRTPSAKRRRRSPCAAVPCRSPAAVALSIRSTGRPVSWCSGAADVGALGATAGAGGAVGNYHEPGPQRRGRTGPRRGDGQRQHGDWCSAHLRRHERQSSTSPSPTAPQRVPRRRGRLAALRRPHAHLARLVARLRRLRPVDARPVTGPGLTSDLAWKARWRPRLDWHPTAPTADPAPTRGATTAFVLANAPSSSGFSTTFMLMGA